MEMSHEHLPSIHIQGHTNTEPSKPSHRAIKTMDSYAKTRLREYDIQGRTNTEPSKPSNKAVKTKGQLCENTRTSVQVDVEVSVKVEADSYSNTYSSTKQIQSL